MKAIAWGLVVIMSSACGSKAQDRVESAKVAKLAVVRSKCAQAGLTELPTHLLMRAFKEERMLQVWGSASTSGPYKLVDTYPIAAMSGKLGPKRKEGDLQVPEGLYVVDVFNPKSQFLLSVRINYPNASDRLLSDKETPGGDIYIHGGQASIGCLAMTDDKIQEIYLLALNAKANPIPVHVFPAKLTPANLRRLTDTYPQHAAFWKQLEPAYRIFEKSKKVPKSRIDKEGAYVVIP